MYSTSIVYKTNSYYGDINSDPEETLEHRFFAKDKLPDDINEFDKVFIDIWLKNPGNDVIIYNGNKKE